MMLARLLLFGALAIVSTTGCQSKDYSFKKMQAKNPLAKNSPKSPTKMVDVWNTYAQTVPNGKPVRGVAGRVHFYSDAKKKQAVKVDGSMTVYVFDGDQKDPAHSKPLKVFKFNPETLGKHYSFRKPLGHGYDFFLPFDAIDGKERSLCVMARFDDSIDGTLVMSLPVTMTLKGSVPEPSKTEMLAQKTSQLDPIQQVSFNGPATPMPSEVEPKRLEAKPQPERDVATISLTDSMTRRFEQAAPQEYIADTNITNMPNRIDQSTWTGTTPTPADAAMQPMIPDYPVADYPNPTF